MSGSGLRSFEPLKALEILHRNGVRYVLVGGFAARLLGSAVVTEDLDICHARDRPNLEALAAALREMHATLRGAPAGQPFKLDASTLARGDSFTFMTDVSDFDILGTPSGTGGYDELIRSAEELDLGEFKVQVASVDALLRMKRAAGRSKDLMAIPHLEALKDEIEHGGGTT